MTLKTLFSIFSRWIWIPLSIMFVMQLAFIATLSSYTQYSSKKKEKASFLRIYLSYIDVGFKLFDLEFGDYLYFDDESVNFLFCSFLMSIFSFIDMLFYWRFKGSGVILSGEESFFFFSRSWVCHKTILKSVFIIFPKSSYLKFFVSPHFFINSSMVSAFISLYIVFPYK